MGENNGNRTTFWGALCAGVVLFFHGSLEWFVGQFWNWASEIMPNWQSGKIETTLQNFDVWRFLGVILISISIWGAYRHEIKTFFVRTRWRIFPGVRLLGGLSLVRAGDYPVAIQGVSVSLHNLKRRPIKEVTGHVEFVGISEKVKLNLVEKTGTLEDLACIPVGMQVSLHASLPRSLKSDWENFLNSVSLIKVVVICDGSKKVLTIPKSILSAHINGFRERNGKVSRQKLLELKD